MVLACSSLGIDENFEGSSIEEPLVVGKGD